MIQNKSAYIFWYLNWNVVFQAQFYSENTHFVNKIKRNVSYDFALWTVENKGKQKLQSQYRFSLEYH